VHLVGFRFEPVEESLHSIPPVFAPEEVGDVEVAQARVVGASGAGGRADFHVAVEHPLAFFVGEGDFGLLRGQGLSDLLLLQFLQLAQHAAHIPFDDVGIDADLLGRGVDEGGAVPGIVKVEVVDVVVISNEDAHGDLHHLEAEVLLKSPYPVAVDPL